MKDKENLRQRIDEAIERGKAGLRLNLSGESIPLTKQPRENDRGEGGRRSVDEAD